MVELPGKYMKGKEHEDLGHDVRYSDQDPVHIGVVETHFLGDEHGQSEPEIHVSHQQRIGFGL